jgi:type IV pilus assembly protein PilE
MNKGFTILEVIIAVALIGIISAIAIPSYQSYMMSARRTEATAALYDMAARMERFNTANNTYVGATVAGIGAQSPTPEGNYTLSITAQTANTFTIQATPAVGSPQTSDATCASFTLTHTGVQGITGSGSVQDCWRR